jgi:hypothetical protein
VGFKAKTAPANEKPANPAQPCLAVSNKAAAANDSASTAARIDQDAKIQRKLVRYTVLLVLVGFLTACVICWQAVETRRAANAAAESVGAVHRQTNAIIRSQLPQIAASARDDPTRTLADEEAPRVTIRVFNQGLTAAYDFLYETWIELLPQPFVDFTESADHFVVEHASVLLPRTQGQTLNIPIRRGISKQELADLRHLKLYACIRILVTYKDAFDPDRRWFTTFGFQVLANGLSFLSKYNDAGEYKLPT